MFGMITRERALCAGTRVMTCLMSTLAVSISGNKMPVGCLSGIGDRPIDDHRAGLFLTWKPRRGVFYLDQLAISVPPDSQERTRDTR
ncbi:hypothetical protein EI94DRAFT_837137 [Lactarius quietus]|nr:hypothetical protein EI94DRAFT_837137 [Lactarius quietus]